jgi:gluconokinase
MQVGKDVSEGIDIDMIAIGSIWHSILACDKNFRPITRTYSWLYTGASSIAQELRNDSDFTNKFYQTTGCMVNATYPAFKLIDLQRQGLKLSDCIFMGQGTYNFYRLTNEFLLSESMASGSGFLDIHTKKFSKDVLDFLGIGKNQFGSLCDYREVRPLSKEGARILGLKSGIPVITAQPDGGLNQVGAGALGDDVMTLSVGTSAALRISTTRPVIPDKPSTWCYLSPAGWLSGAATSGACNCVDWAKNKFFVPGTTYKDLELTGIDIANLPVYLPFLYGERCPGWNDARKAAFYDLTSNHSNIDLYYSVLEGVLFNIYQCYEILTNINNAPCQIKLSGGILNSKIWTQMCCDIFDREMECSHQNQMSLIGGAVLALELGGVIDSIRNYRTEPGTMIRPDPEKAKEYKRRYKIYKDFYDKSV